MLSKELIIKIFEYGVDYGLLLAESERQNEEWFDGFQGEKISKKFHSPSSPAPRRQRHSEAWIAAKKQSLIKFAEILTRIKPTKKRGEYKPQRHKQLSLFDKS